MNNEFNWNKINDKIFTAGKKHGKMLRVLDHVLSFIKTKAGERYVYSLPKFSTKITPYFKGKCHMILLRKEMTAN